MKNLRNMVKEVASMISLYDEGEREAIAQIIIESVFNVSRSEIIVGKAIAPDAGKELEIANMVGRINSGEPIQYITGLATFLDRDFHVSASVLIPRQETEELVLYVLSTVRKMNKKDLQVLDIGTGSGCIAVSIACEAPDAKVYASDISLEALNTASRNANKFGVEISFMHHNILRQTLPFQMFDVIVSNPPYIAESEQSSMQRNVLSFEPHVALFVPDDDPLIYYKAIARQASEALRSQGMLAVEINERFGSEVEGILQQERFIHTEILRDINGKERFVAGFRA